MENEKNMKKEVKCSYARDVSVSNASLIEAEEEKEEN